jgi:hypothetical protein
MTPAGTTSTADEAGETALSAALEAEAADQVDGGVKVSR